jgi:hypothetical protein
LLLIFGNKDSNSMQVSDTSQKKMYANHST